MPDFKGLDPIIKSNGDNTPTRINVAPAKKPNYTPLKESDLSQESDIFTKLQTLSQKGASRGFQDKGVFVTYDELDKNKRYAHYNPTVANPEDYAAYGQSNLDAAANGLLKGMGLAATTFAGGFGVLYGAAKAPFTGKLSDIWDNEVMRGLDAINNEVDNNLLPNYYTDAEKNASWYSTDNWFKTNFLFDKLIKNSGFAVGAMYSGNLANASLLATGAKLGGLAAKGAAVVEASQAFKLFTPLLW